MEIDISEQWKLYGDCSQCIVQNHVRVVKDIMILRLGVLFVKSFSARYLIHVKRSKCI